MKYWKPALFIGTVVSVFLFGCRQGQPVPASDTSHIKLVGECVAIYYKIDSSAYITQQQHEFTPEMGQLQVTANEPTGRFEYLLQQEQFSSAQGPEETLSDLPKSFFNKALGTAVFYAMCAGGSLLDVEKMTPGEPVKIEGQWYKPFWPAWPSNELSVSLMQNQTSNQIELVTVIESATGLHWMARSYNLRYNSDLQKRLPRTIDIYDVAGGVASKKLVAKFEYKDLGLSSVASPDE